MLYVFLVALQRLEALQHGGLVGTDDGNSQATYDPERDSFGSQNIRAKNQLATIATPYTSNHKVS